MTQLVTAMIADPAFFNMGKFALRFYQSWLVSFFFKLRLSSSILAGKLSEHANGLTRELESKADETLKTLQRQFEYEAREKIKSLDRQFSQQKRKYWMVGVSKSKTRFCRKKRVFFSRIREEN